MSRREPKRIAVAGQYPNNIRELCLELGMNTVDLARVMDIAEATAYDIVSGKRKPEFDNERKLELIFKKPITEMYESPYEGLKINWELIPQGKKKVEKST